MRSLFITLLFGVVLLLQVPLLFADEGFRVVASIKPIHSILSSLMQGADEPQLLVKQGQIPYGYELDEQQKKDLSRADFIVWVGPELEKFLVEPMSGVMPQAKVITVLDDPSIKVLPSRWDEYRRDPFFWLDSRNMLILIDELTRELMAADSTRAHLYRRNRDALFKRMSELDRRLEYGYRGLKSGVGIAYYDTLQYFEQAYALKVRGRLAQNPMQDMDASRLLDGRSRMADGYYSCLLTEYGMKMPDLPLLTGSSSIKQAKLDSFGSRFTPGPDLYFQLMDYNTNAIKECLHHGTLEGEDVDTQEPAQSFYISGKFMLTDHNGGLVTEKDLTGKYQIILFGYTFCPDICPTSLQVLSLAMERLGDKAEKIQPYFVTVDPERDTVKAMKRFVGYFSKKIIGLTGSKSMIERVAEQFNVRYEKVVEEGMDPDMYIMDHTASAYLMAPDGTFITKFAYGISPKQLVDKINEYVP
ncbi:MAG: zinc ABC transporter solute-binding protein [Gammaproteobacteria bacterium]|nr:zinc ABC transporter solute-binding protein [Gammaproteobacteria bacterium]